MMNDQNEVKKIIETSKKLSEEEIKEAEIDYKGKLEDEENNKDDNPSSVLSEEEIKEAEIRKDLEEQIALMSRKIEEAVNEQRMLEEELDNVINDTIKIASDASTVTDKVAQSIEGTGEAMKEINEYTESLFHILDELTVSYFSLKNVSAASKSLTEYSQIYNTRYHFYNELRRIALGYVVGVDNYIINSETLRMKVEKTVLQNSDYWLSYALSAVMLWVNNEEEAAARAIVKALDLNNSKACLFFLLVNLRFSRIDAARKWLLKYLERFDISEVSDEFQYLLEAYLYGCFGKSITFHREIDQVLMDIIKKVKVINVGYERRVATSFRDYMMVYPHTTKHEFINLSRYCSDYDDMLYLLSLAEKNLFLANYFTDIYAREEFSEQKLSQKIENTLYNLINAYDDDEYEVYKKIKYYEAIISAKGDITVATYNYEYLYENNQKFSLDELLLRWALADKDINVDTRLRHFSIEYLNDSILKGVNQYQVAYQSLMKKEFIFNIDEYKIPYQPGGDEEAYKCLNKNYSKTLLWYTLEDKFVMISLMLTVASIATLGLLPFYFELIALIVGIICFVIFGGFSIFLIVKKIKKFNKRKAKYVKQLEDTIKDFDTWYDLYNEEDNKNLVLMATIERFKGEGEKDK